MEELVCWGHNPGQRFVKDTLTVNGKRRDLRPYPAVIAPWAKADDTGLAQRTRDLSAKVGGRHYIGGEAAERLPMANREQSRGRLDAENAMYQALAQMSAQHAGLNGKTRVLIATALPVGWRDADAEAQIKAHIRRALADILTIVDIYVQSEPNAVVGSELLDDDGNIRQDQAQLATDLVCVGDIGGGTLNRTVLEKLRALPGEAASPDLGSSRVVKNLAQRRGVQYVDAERQLETAARTPGRDTVADALLQQYAESVITEFREAWKSYTTALHIFAGGTAHWIAPELLRAFPGARIVAKPQQAIAIGLWRYARRKAQRGT